PESYTLSLHDALPIFSRLLVRRVHQDHAALLLRRQMGAERQPAIERDDARLDIPVELPAQGFRIDRMQFDRRQPVLPAQQLPGRSEEHTSELQSRENL